MRLVLHPLFVAWVRAAKAETVFGKATQTVIEDVAALLTALGRYGRTLGLEESRRIVSSSVDMHELRRTPPSDTLPDAVTPPVVRVLYAFAIGDGGEVAIVLHGGDKSGRGNDWYDDFVPLAEDRYRSFCATHGYQEVTR